MKRTNLFEDRYDGFVSRACQNYPQQFESRSRRTSVLCTRISDRDGRPTYAYETLRAGGSVDVARGLVINDSSSVLMDETQAVTAVGTGFGQLLKDLIVIQVARFPQQR